MDDEGKGEDKKEEDDDDEEEEDDEGERGATLLELCWNINQDLRALPFS